MPQTSGPLLTELASQPQNTKLCFVTPVPAPRPCPATPQVKFLIQAGADVLARCYGDFFKPGSPVNYGEYPLSFAACTGQKDIVSYLKRHGARVNHDRDMYGNTALHLCVVHDQIDMYDHLVEYCGASEHVRNNRGQTPLLLAASLGKLEVGGHVGRVAVDLGLLVFGHEGRHGLADMSDCGVAAASKGP